MLHVVQTPIREIIFGFCCHVSTWNFQGIHCKKTYKIVRSNIAYLINIMHFYSGHDIHIVKGHKSKPYNGAMWILCLIPHFSFIKVSYLRENKHLLSIVWAYLRMPHNLLEKPILSHLYPRFYSWWCLHSPKNKFQVHGCDLHQKVHHKLDRWAKLFCLGLLVGGVKNKTSFMDW